MWRPGSLTIVGQSEPKPDSTWGRLVANRIARMGSLTNRQAMGRAQLGTRHQSTRPPNIRGISSRQQRIAQLSERISSGAP
jgi:hypothetical protein